MDWLELAAALSLTSPDPASLFAPHVNEHRRHRTPVEAGPCLNPERQQ